jgi:opacity protein-like surface antigen
LFSLRKISVSVYAALLPGLLIAGDPYIMPAGASQAGMAYVSVMKPGFWSSFHNQASLSLYRKFSCGVNYENRFGLKELGTCTAGIAGPVGRASLAGVYSRFGYTDFRREMTGIACALPVSEKISAGIQIDYFSERTIGEYNNIHILTFETGVLLTASDDVLIGIHLFNPIPNSIRKNDMVSALTAGVGATLSNNLFAGLEAEMTTRGTTDLRMGFEYEVAGNFIIRGGFRTMNSSFTFGIGYRAGPAVVDIAFTTHEKLGITSSISLIFNIKS